ncbi:MAG: DUF1905 domain-containing protein [Bacteroidetes bacterium]|nr:DUF1905 domain-containing protein [Bacteroidota bacterium]
MEYTFKGKLEYIESSLGWHCFIPVPDKITKKLIEGKDRRVVCRINDKLTLQAALMPSKEGYHYILLNKENRTRLKAQPGDAVNVVLTKDNSEYGIATPDFFKVFCDEDPEGSKLFHQLTAGLQRSLLYLITKPKSENKQLEKAWIIFDYLKSVDGKLDFKELQAAFKNNRFTK